MEPFLLSNLQNDIVNAPPLGSLFLEGPAGCGKTTAAVERLLKMIRCGIPAENILVLAPQRTAALPYYRALQSPDLPPGGMVDIVTMGGLGQRMIELFWALIARNAGFEHPENPPSFLTLETAQYYLAGIVAPLFRQGMFDTIHLDRNRLLTQIIDNLNKAAATGMQVGEISLRLKAAYQGKPAQERAFDDAQQAADRFRTFCMQNNLLDFSLQLDVFARHVWTEPACRQYLSARYRHLIYDNAEEDVPVVHDMVAQWLPDFDSSLIIFDQDAGYRVFLGADVDSAYALKSLCEESQMLADSFINPPEMEAFHTALSATIQRTEATLAADPCPAASFHFNQFLPQTIEWLGQAIQHLVDHEGVPPGEIVVMAPYMSDSMCFAISNRLESCGIPSISHRPSRSLAEEPVVRCLLTLAKLGHPHWNLATTRAGVRNALLLALQDMDLVRAELLAKAVYRENSSGEGLQPFEKVNPATRERITYTLGASYNTLVQWLNTVMTEPEEELDVFISRLYSEVLSQPGFGFHARFDTASIASRLVESAQKFRRSVQMSEPAGRGREYIRMVEEGVLAAQYLFSWDTAENDAVLIAPAFTFVIANRPVRFQFWLDIGSTGWWERLYQPLTHPIVLSRRWQEGAIWTDADEYRTNQASLARLTVGLCRRCSEHVYLCAATYSESGEEQRGPLIAALQKMTRRFQFNLEVADV